jgi:hypothetical protein
LKWSDSTERVGAPPRQFAPFSRTLLACGDLTGFINHVMAQSGKQLTVAQANQLLAAAAQIRAVLGCST